MPTDYLGDEDATQAPAAQPGPEGSPTCNIPVDGDLGNGDSVGQAFKVLADYVAWLYRPFLSNIASFFIMCWRTAKKHRRALMDSAGFLRGAYWSKDQLWLFDFVGTGSNPSGTGNYMFGTYPEWRYTAIDGGDGMSSRVENVVMSDPPVAALKLIAGPGADERVSVVSGRYGDFTDDVHVTMNALASDDGGGAGVAVLVGMGNHSDNPDPLDTQNVCGFYTTAGEWLATTMIGGAPTTTPTGVNISSTTMQRLRIEWCGANVELDGVRKVRFFIDDDLVATHTTNLPISKRIDMIAAATGGAAGRALFLGPLQLRGSLFAADVG